MDFLSALARPILLWLCCSECHSGQSNVLQACCFDQQVCTLRLDGTVVSSGPTKVTILVAGRDLACGCIQSFRHALYRVQSGTRIATSCVEALLVAATGCR